VQGPIEIVVDDVPGIECSINFHGHWRKQWKARGKMIEATKDATAEQTKHLKWPLPEGRWRVSITVAWPKGRQSVRDQDNLVPMLCKPVWDGLKAALGVDDAFFDIGDLEQTRAKRDEPSGWVRIWLEHIPITEVKRRKQERRAA
jgi:hypothetical protein